MLFINIQNATEPNCKKTNHKSAQPGRSNSSTSHRWQCHGDAPIARKWKRYASACAFREITQYSNTLGHMTQSLCRHTVGACLVCTRLQWHMHGVWWQMGNMYCRAWLTLMCDGQSMCWEGARIGSIPVASASGRLPAPPIEYAPAPTAAHRGIPCTANVSCHRHIHAASHSAEHVRTHRVTAPVRQLMYLFWAKNVSL